MAFMRKKFTSTSEILDLMKSDADIMGSTAVIYVHRKDKVSGKIYLREGVEQGIVYAAHVSNMPFHIGKRVKSLIDPDDYKDLMRQVNGDTTDPAIARLVVTNQWISESIVDSFIREYLFSAAAEIFSWEEVTAGWEKGTETRDFASRHYIGLDLLQKKTKDRNDKYIKAVKDTRLPEEQLENLRLLRNSDLDLETIENKNLRSILSLADGKNTLGSFKEETGMLDIPTFIAVHTLWINDHLSLFAGDVPVYPPVPVVAEVPKIEDEKPQEPLEIEKEEVPPKPDEIIEVEEPEPVAEYPEPVEELSENDDQDSEELSMLQKLNSKLDGLQKASAVASKTAIESSIYLDAHNNYIIELKNELEKAESEKVELVENQEKLNLAASEAKEKLEHMITAINMLTAE